VDSSLERIRAVALSYVWSILFWVGFDPVLAGQDKVRLLERGINTPYWILLLTNGVWLLAAGLLAPPIFAIVRRNPIVKATAFMRIGGYALGSILFVIAATCIRWVLLPPWDAVGQRFGTRSFNGLIHGAYIFGNLIWDYILIVVAAHAYWYFRRARDQELERAELRQALAASELQTLKNQLHPHFLFNTLQGISALIETDRARAKAMVLKVSSLLRTALEYGNSDLITFEDELKFIEDYLSLEKMRLEDRLEVRWGIHRETREMLVPQLILQPLVENAILHGVACCRAGGWIEISSQLAKGKLEIQVRNSVGGKPQKGLGLGLQNTKSRLRFLYTDEAAFSFDFGGEGVAVATLVLPTIGSRQASWEEVPVLRSPQ
jgi:two-component system, LytTR family, sensor kinase